MSQTNGATPPRALSAEERLGEISRLAALDPALEYPFERTESARKLGIPMAALDKAVLAGRRKVNRKAASTENGRAQDPGKFVDDALLPELVIERGKLGAAVDELRDKLAKSGELFDRDGPVKVVRDGDGIPFVLPMTAESVVLEAYRICRPKKLTAEGKVDTDFSDRFARLYLAMRGEWVTGPKPLLPDGSRPSSTSDWCRSWSRRGLLFSSITSTLRS